MDSERHSHPLGAFPVPLQRLCGYQIGYEVLSPLLEPAIAERVLVGDDLVIDTAKAQDNGDEQPRPVLPRRAVDQDGVRRGVRGQVSEDGEEGARRMRGIAAEGEDAAVDADEALHGG